MIRTTVDWGGARTNGKMRFRKNGRWIKTPALDVDVCPECGAINIPTVTPEYSEGGFINPQSMKPKRATTCHRCNLDFAQHKQNQQLDQWINAIGLMVQQGWMQS